MVKAAVCREFGKPLVIEEIALAEPNAGEVKVQIKACAICHSDNFYDEGAWGGTLPAVYGHEAAGVVGQVGDGVRNVSVGNHVVVTLVRSCGECPCCSRGYHGSCESKFPLDAQTPLKDASGNDIVHGLRTAAFAEQVVVDASQVVAIDKSVPFESASLLACGVITGLGAVINTARIEAGSDVVVIGCGGVGLNAVQGAALSGARKLIALDLADDKLQAAMDFGATHALRADAADVTEQVRALTDGRGVDYVFVTVGAKAAFDQSYALMAKGGALVLVGMPPVGVKSEFEILDFADETKRILGSKMGSSNIHVDLPRLVELYKQGRLKLDELVTGRYALEEINEAFAAVNRGEALRNVIIF